MGGSGGSGGQTVEGSRYIGLWEEICRGVVLG